MNKLINSFLDKNENFYQDFKSKKIRKKIYYGYHCDTDQIYCHLNLIKKQDSAYYKFLKIVMSYFNLHKLNIIEMSCGTIPVLANIASKYSKHVDAVNYKVLYNKYHKIKVFKANLNNNFDLSNYDLIIAFRPCNPTENIIDMCFKYNKNFVIYLCPCILQPKFHTVEFTTLQQWHNYIFEKIKSNKKYKVQIITSPKLQDQMPIIIAKYLP